MEWASLLSVTCLLVHVYHFQLDQRQILGINTLPFTHSGHRVERGLPLRLVQLSSSLDGRPAAPRGGALPQPAG